MEFGKIGLPIISVNEGPSSDHGFDSRVYLLFHTAARDTDLGRKIVQKIKSDHRAAALEGKLISRGGSGAHSFDYECLAAWWLWRANNVGPEEAEENLTSFLERDTIEAFETIWVEGVEVANRMDLAEGVEIVPPREMPDSGDKERILNAIWTHRVGPISVPSAALVCRSVVNKITPDLPTFDQGAVAAREKLHTICLLLNCVEGVHCSAGYSTAYSTPETPLGPFGGAGGGFSIRDVNVLSRAPVPDNSGIELSKLLNGYRRLPEDWRLRIQRAVMRLAQSKARMEISDKVLDLGISLEMLLLNRDHKKSGKPDQLSAMFRTRGAWLIGCDFDDRMRSYDILNQVYNLRSQVAHNGFAEELEKMHPEARVALTVEQQTVAERIIRRLIIDGPPDWKRLILGESLCSR